MPFMDDAMLDLFGEDAVGDNLGALQPHEPESRSVIRRLDQLHRSGCCQRLTWSKNATLAYLSADGRKIHFRLVVRDPESRKWVLSNESPTPVLAAEDISFVHIQWSSVGLDLVALDQTGRPHLYQLAYALDRVQAYSFNPPSPPDDLNTVVGLHWLPVHPNQFRPPHISVGIREGNEWTNKMGVSSVDWPHHQIDGKSAFLLVTESHIVKLYFQQEFGPWSEVTASLWESSGSEEILTHAAFAEANKHMYLTVYSSHGSLRLYKLHIDWAVTQSKDPSRPFQIASAQLRIEYLHIIQTVLPHPSPDVGMDVQQSLYRSRLSSLSILQPSPLAPAEPSVYQVQAVFTCAGDMYSLQGSSASCSTIVRWEIVQEEPELLDVWKTFKQGNAKLAPEAVTVMKRLPDLSMPKIILGVTSILYEPLLALTFSDGSIQFHNRHDLQLITADNDDTKAGSYPQSGFAFLPSERCSDVTLTPDVCMAASQTVDGSIVLNIMEYLPGWNDSQIDNHRTQAALNTIARQISITTGLQIAADEPFALIPISLPIDHRRYLMKQVYRMLQRPFDFTIEESRKMSSRIMRDSLLAKVLSTQLFTSYTTHPTTLDLPGKIVWVTLNLRMIDNSIASTVTPKEPSRADAVIALAGSVKWCVDLSILILDDLAEAMKHLPSPITTPSLLSFLAPSASPSVLILLSSAPRSLLRVTLELLKIYFTKLTQCNPTTVTQRVQVQELVQYYKTLPFKLPHLESVLQEVDNSVRTAYTNAKISSGGRVECETKMLVDGEVPQCLEKVVEYIFSPKIAGKVVDSVDQGAVWGWDTSWLGLRDGKEKGMDKRRYDVIIKTVVKEGTKLRVCKRCGSVMEDLYGGVEGQRQGLPPWLVHAQRNCVCLGYWMVEG